MKIVHLVGDTVSTGGVESLVRDYAFNFDKSHNVELVAVHKRDTPSAIELQLSDKNVKITYLNDKKQSTFNKLKKIFRLLKKIQTFKSYFKSKDIDIIHNHLISTKFIYFSRKYLKKTKIFCTVHNEPKICFEINYIKKFEKLFVKKLIKTNGLRLIALHENTRIELNEMFNVDNTIVLNNGIDLERFDRNKYNKKEIRESLGFNDDDFIVGHIGRFAVQKNHKFLIEVFTNLLKTKPNAKLLLIGDGPLKNDVLKQIEQNNIQDKVTMLENRADIPELMLAMEVFVFPSIYEGLGIVLVEAQAMGIKCIVSKEVPMAAHLTDNYISLSLEDSLDTWCDAILDENIKTTPYGSLEDYNMKNVVKKLESIYKEEI